MGRIEIRMSNLSEQISDLSNTAEIAENERPVKLSPLLPSKFEQWFITLKNIQIFYILGLIKIGTHLLMYIDN